MEAIPGPEGYYESESFAPMYDGMDGCQDCGGSRGSTCGEPCEPYGACGPAGCPWTWYENLSLMGGAQGFKGPVDEGRNGNFGFNYGANWGGPLWNQMGIGYQVGGRIVHSNFQGNQTLGVISEDDRTQYFVTAGIFHRPRSTIWQWGVVIDWLDDSYYLDMSMAQIRAELALVNRWGNEIGFKVASGTDSDSAQRIVNMMLITETWEPTDRYEMFLRRHFAGGGEGRISGGASGNGDGLLGLDFWFPFASNCAMEGGVSYLKPHEGRGLEGQPQEQWGISINLVWYPGHTARTASGSRWRPLMGVADNSSMFVDKTQTP
jgi:hypothetical protein